MNRPSRHGKVDGATIAIIGIGLLIVLLAAIIISGMDWRGSAAISENEQGWTEAELMEHILNLQATNAKVEADLAKAEAALIAASQPTSAHTADPKIEEYRRQVSDQLERITQLQARLDRTLRSSTQPVTFPTMPETQPTLPATAPADK